MQPFFTIFPFVCYARTCAKEAEERAQKEEEEQRQWPQRVAHRGRGSVVSTAMAEAAARSGLPKETAGKVGAVAPPSSILKLLNLLNFRLQGLQALWSAIQCYTYLYTYLCNLMCLILFNLMYGISWLCNGYS